MITYKILSLLLCYPQSEIQANMDELEEALGQEGALRGRALKKLLVFLEDYRSRPLLDLQADYVEIFDRGRAHSLHIFEHVHGESRFRGSAMVDLADLYARAGFETEGGELPDFLPLFLEFLSTQPPGEAQTMLRDVQHITAVIGAKLKKRRSPWVAMFDAIEALAGQKIKPEILAKALEDSAKEITTLDELDKEWEDSPAFDGDPMDACNGCSLASAHGKITDPSSRSQIHPQPDHGRPT
jgi:nitrate reductase delta subunit